MSKFSNLKSWLTLTDAAKHLAVMFGEEVTEADILQLVLEGQLRLSVNFVNRSPGRRGKLVPIEEASYKEASTLDEKSTVRLYKGPVLSQNDTKVIVIELENEIFELDGIFDLPMLGGERLDVEHRYQRLTGGPSVTGQSVDGAFVEGNGGEIFQLQASLDDNEHRGGSSAHLERLKRDIAKNRIGKKKATELLREYKEQRKKFRGDMKARPQWRRYYPTGGLPNDAVFVVRSSALREFEANIAGANESEHTSREHVSDKLAILNQASRRFWGQASRVDRGSHPTNSKVEVWLQQHDYSETLARKAASIIRPEWAPSGRRPEE